MGSPSRSSMASKAPVEAPDGTAARPVLPSSRPTSTSTVGLPRESRISRATTTSMDGTSISFLDVTLEVRGGLPYGCALRLEPNRPGVVGHRPTVPWTGGTCRRYPLFTRGTKGFADETRLKSGKTNDPAPARTGENAPGRGARGDGDGPLGTGSAGRGRQPPGVTSGAAAGPGR
ncbi:hypothetical protein SGPA1_51020 [Streptomyces misionensis JCM 4497]